MSITFVINRICAGRKLSAMRKSIRTEFPAAGVEIVTGDNRSTILTLAAAAAAEGADTVVAVGGDGTANAVMNGIIGSGSRLGLIPCGTANDLARRLNIPTDVSECCRLIKTNHSELCDVICINDWYFLTVGGMLLPHDVAVTADRLRRSNLLARIFSRFAGKYLYHLSLLVTFKRSTRHSHHITLSCADQVSSYHVYSIIIANQPRTGLGFEVSPTADANDGLVDIFLITDHSTRTALRRTVLAIRSGQHLGNSNVVLRRARALKLHCNEPLGFFGDGEALLSGLDFNITTLPSAIRILAPPCESRGQHVS